MFRVVIAGSFERMHRRKVVDMDVYPRDSSRWSPLPPYV